MTMEPVTTSLASQYLIEFGFAGALIACLCSRHWGYALFAALALAESHADLRYPFHGWVRDALLGGSAVEGAKESMQSTFLYVVGMLSLAILLLLTPALVRASTGQRLTIFGTAIVMGMLAIELISLHRLDAVIYHAQGPFTRAAIVYFIGAAAIASGALMAPRRKWRSARISAARDA
jgi:hypothetical protein